MPEQRNRWSDEKLEQFYEEFREHLANEELEKKQQGEIHEALFRLADRKRNISPGVIELLGQIGERTAAMEITSDRQKRFIGGVLFAFSCMGFFLTDTAHKLMQWVRGI